MAGARSLHLLVRAGDHTAGGAMVLRFSERVAIDDEDNVAFGAYLGGAGGTREAVLRAGSEGLTEIAVEGAEAPGGGRYVGFGPWPTVGAGWRDGVRRGTGRRTWAARRLRRGSGKHASDCDHG